MYAPLSHVQVWNLTLLLCSLESTFPSFLVGLFQCTFFGSSPLFRWIDGRNTFHSPSKLVDPRGVQAPSLGSRSYSSNGGHHLPGKEYSGPTLRDDRVPCNGIASVPFEFTDSLSKMSTAKLISKALRSR